MLAPVPYFCLLLLAHFLAFLLAFCSSDIIWYHLLNLSHAFSISHSMWDNPERKTVKILVNKQHTLQIPFTFKMYQIMGMEYWYSPFLSFQKNCCDAANYHQNRMFCSVTHNLMLSHDVISVFVWMSKDIIPALKAFD
jgi:hypothetical protein